MPTGITGALQDIKPLCPLKNSVTLGTQKPYPEPACPQAPALKACSVPGGDFTRNSSLSTPMPSKRSQAPVKGGEKAKMFEQ